MLSLARCSLNEAPRGTSLFYFIYLFTKNDSTFSTNMLQHFVTMENSFPHQRSTGAPTAFGPEHKAFQYTGSSYEGHDDGMVVRILCGLGDVGGSDAVESGPRLSATKNALFEARQDSFITFSGR
jgi:hypothetical protein